MVCKRQTHGTFCWFRRDADTSCIRLMDCLHSDCGIATRGAARTFSEGMRRSTVAHFARKVRGTNIVAAKHGLKIQQSHAPECWPCSLRVRGPHFASKVSYNAGAATDDYAGQRKSPLRGRCCQYLIFYLDHPKVMRRPSGIIKSSLRLLQVIDLRPRVALPSAASNVTVGRE